MPVISRDEIFALRVEFTHHKFPSTKVLQLHKRFEKPESALITQVRTGKIGLPAFLYSPELVNNSQCECGYRSQTVRHIVSECRRFTRLRKETWRDVQRKEPFGVVEWRENVNPPLAHKESSIFFEENRAPKVVPRHSGGITMIDSNA